MAKNLKPCNFIVTRGGKDISLSYPEMVEYLASHPELMEEGKAERRKIGGAKQKVAAIAKEAAVENTPEGIAARIRNKKQKGALSAIDFGISVTVYNGALEFMASQVEKGTKLGNAIANTIKWIDEKVKGEKWNKGAFGRYMNDTYKVTLGDGREVEVIRDDSKETAEVINGWYQPIEQKILDSKEESLPAKTWADRLKSKEDEDLWTGVRAFLEEKGTERVSRQELLDFIKDNRVEIVEVVKGEGLDANERIKVDKEIFDRVYKKYAKDRTYIVEKNGKYELWDVEESKRKPSEIFETYDEAKKVKDSYDKYRLEKNNPIQYIPDDVEDLFDEEIKLEQQKIKNYSPTKFSQYQLEGDKENYKEVLVTLPSRVSNFKKKTYERAMDLVKAIRYKELPDVQLKEIIRNEYGITEDIVKRVRESDNSPAELNDALNTIRAAEEEELTELSSKDFQSSHFDEPNILVHLRMNTRTDAEGNKVLFLEEVQSDWGQEGKKKGFKEGEKITKVYATERANRVYDIRENNLSVIDTIIADSKDEALSKYLKNPKIREGAIPSAPFVTDTNAWVKLGLKTALKEAVAQGVDRVAWSTGTQQFDRWGTEKIDWVTTMKPKGGSIVVKDTNKAPIIRGRRTTNLASISDELDPKKEIVRIAEKWGLQPSDLEYRVTTGAWTINIQEQFAGTAFEGMNVDEKALSEKGVTINSKQDLKDAIDRTLSREKNEQERQKLTDRIWERMQKEDKGTSLPRKEGMESFYGVPSENKEGIVGGIAKSLIKDLTGKEGKIGETKIVTQKQDVKLTDTEFDISEAPKELQQLLDKYEEGISEGNYTELNKFSKEAKELGYEVDYDLNGEVTSFKRVSGKPQQSTQNSIEITPELKASVEAGMPLFGTATPEQKLKQAFKEWRNEQGKMGIVPNWERLAEADIKLLKALGEYIATKLKKGAYDFNKFLKDIAASGVENIDADKERWRKFYDDTVEKEAPEAPAAPKAEKKAEGEPEGKKPVRELPEGEVEETEKPILGRAFRGTTNEALAEKLAQMGLYRTPANIAEAFELGQQIVSEIGTDEAIKLGTKGEVPNGLVRIGILKAVLEDINKQRDSLPVPDGTKGEERYLDALDQLGDKYAEALAAFSPSLTESGQVLRAWQEVIESAEFEFDYEGRKAKYKTLFGDEAYTKEVDERFKEYDRKIKQAEKEKKELQDKIDRLEAQGIVDNVSAQKKPITSFFKEAAARVRKLKLSRPGIFSSATPASLAWDATIEAVAVVLEASGTLEEAIVAGVKKLKTTDWYKSLTDAKKNDSEKELAKYVKDTYIIKAMVDDNGKIQIPSGLLRSYVTSGVKDANAIIDDILSYLKESNLALTEADVRAAILEVGKKEAPKATEITKNVNTLKTIIKMIGQLEQVEQGRRIAKGEGKKKEMDKTIASLKKQIEQKHLEQFGVKPGALTDEQRLANIKKNALQRIADMKAMKPRPEPRERVKWDAEMSRIANEEFRLKEKWNEEFREAERKKMSEIKKLFQGAYLAVNLSKTIMTGIGDLGVLLIQGSMLPFRSASVTKEAIANMGRAFLSQEEYVNQLRKINESELYRVVRKSGLDLPQITSLEIERVEEANIGALGETIFDVLMLPFKYVPKIGPKMYEWAKNHINPARVFNRTQTAYMNTLRYGSFTLSANNLLEKGITYEDNPKAYKDVAAMINTMSGRTRLIGEESAATMKALNLVFYSPKNWASVIKMFTPVILYHVGRRRSDSIGVLGMSEAQQTFIRTYASYVATSAALMFLLKAITTDEGDEDEEKKREEGNVTIDWENPQSSAFNKIRIGNQVFDPWGGKQQIITLQARMMIHFMGGRAFKDPYTGMEKTLEETPRFKHPLGLMNEYAKGKFAPYASAAVKLLSSQKAKGREWYIRQPSEGGPMFNILDPVSESYTNITYQAINDLYGHQPLTISEVMTLFLIAGGGVNTLNDQESKTIVSQIREKINPGEDEKRRYAANMASRLKDGDTEGAATVYDEAMGIKGISDKAKIARLRREGANDLYESATKDVVGQRYGVDDKYRKYLLQVVYQNKPVAITSSMSEKKKQIISAINGLTPEQKEEVKADYNYRYEELMNVARGIDKLTSQPQKYEKRANREYWVSQYKKATGKK